MKQFFQLLTVICLLPLCHCLADGPDYSYAKLPPQLLKHASAVIRDYHMHIRIVSASEIYVSQQYAVTVLKQEGRRYAKLEESYDKFRNVDKVKGYLYDKDGNEIQKIKSSDIQDVAPYDYYVKDYRYKFYESNYSVYPYTYSFEVETKYTTSFYLPDWRPQFGADCAVENADVEIEYPADFPIRYQVYHIDKAPEKTIEEGMNVLKLSVANIAAMNSDDNFSARNAYSLPSLLLAPNKFELEDMSGDMTSWKGFGQFMCTLNANRDILPAATKQLVHQLTDTCKSPFSRIDVLYKYMQTHTHYYLIALGIGGWQTLDAKFVAKKGYGDCKALSNYMKALLKEAGVTSYQALVFAGEENKYPMQVDFPNNQFDHVILCVPGQHDSTWLECTSQTLPTGYLSSFTANRNVLLCTPDGGFVVKTPAYEDGENVFSRNAVMHVNDNDEVDGDVSLKYKGYFFDAERGKVVDEGRSKILNHLNSKFTLPTYNVSNYSITGSTENKIPVLDEQVLLKGSANITRSGSRLFIEPEVVPLKIKSPGSYTERKEPFRLHSSYCINDTSTLKIDGAYTKEYLPEAVNISYPFATYSCRAFFDDNNVVKVVRTYTQKDGVYAANLFPDYIKLCKAVNEGANVDKIILVKKK